MFDKAGIIAIIATAAFFMTSPHVKIVIMALCILAISFWIGEKHTNHRGNNFYFQNLHRLVNNSRTLDAIISKTHFHQMPASREKLNYMDRSSTQDEFKTRGHKMLLRTNNKIKIL